MTSHRSTQFHIRNRNNSDCRFCKENGHTVDQCSALATTECKYCHDLGHTTRRCPKLAEKDERSRHMVRATRKSGFEPDTNGYAKARGTFRRRVGKDQRVTKTLPMGRFAILNAREAETERMTSIPSNADTPILNGSWAKPLKVAVATDSVVTSASPGPQSTYQPKKKQTGRWADMADSESDSDEEGIFF